MSPDETKQTAVSRECSWAWRAMKRGVVASTEPRASAMTAAITRRTPLGMRMAHRAARLAGSYQIGE